MKYAEINKRYTEIINEYLGNGYTINTASMAGSQGEIAKIDLTDGNSIIRIEIRRFYNEHDDGVEIVVGKCIDDVYPNCSRDNIGIVWSSKLEIVRSERFYDIDRDNDYYGTREEAERAEEVRNKRWSIKHDHYDKYEPTEKAMNIAKRIVQNKLGYKRINIDNLKLQKDKDGYKVIYNGKSYRLH